MQTFPNTVSYRVEIKGSETLEGLDFGNYQCAMVGGCTGVCQGGQDDDFDVSDGDELATVTPEFQPSLQACSDDWNSKFDEVIPNHCFGYSFSETCSSCWETLGCIAGAQITFRAKASVLTQENDALTLREDGEVVWWASMNDLQYAATGDPYWNDQDVTTFQLDLADLPPWQGVTNVLATLMDGDLDFMVSKDSGVDFVELVVQRCPPLTIGTGSTTLPGVSRLWASVHPNPSNPITVIEYEMPESGWTTLDIYNLQGRHVVTLVDEVVSADHHRATWDGRDDAGRIQAAGVYFYRLKSGGKGVTGKIVLLK